MRVFLGIIIGVMLTIGCAYVSDSLATGSLLMGPTTAHGGEHKSVVNWDVVDNDWRVLATRVRETWVRHKG